MTLREDVAVGWEALDQWGDDVARIEPLTGGVGVNEVWSVPTSTGTWRSVESASGAVADLAGGSASCPPWPRPCWSDRASTECQTTDSRQLSPGRGGGDDLYVESGGPCRPEQREDRLASRRRRASRRLRVSVRLTPGSPPAPRCALDHRPAAAPGPGPRAPTSAPRSRKGICRCPSSMDAGFIATSDLYIIHPQGNPDEPWQRTSNPGGSGRADRAYSSIAAPTCPTSTWCCPPGCSRQSAAASSDARDDSPAQASAGTLAEGAVCWDPSGTDEFAVKRLAEVRAV